MGREKTSNQFEKFFFPLPLFFVITFLLHYFFSFFNLHIKLEKKRNILKEKKKSITNQEDGTSFPPHKILKHLEVVRQKFRQDHALQGSLQAVDQLGRETLKEEAKGLMNELCDPEDAEGFTPFMPFLERMCKNDLHKQFLNETKHKRFDGRMCC